MKILLVNKFHYIKGGTETYVFSLAEALRKQGHEVHFFAMKDPKNEPCEDERYFVSPRDYNNPNEKIVSRVSDAANLIWSREARDNFERMLLEIKPDVVHLNLVHRQISLSILDAPSLSEIPVIYTSHEYIMVCPAYTMLNGKGEVCEKCLGGHFWNCVKNKCIKKSLAKSILAYIEASYIRQRNYYNKLDAIIAPSHFMKEKLIEGGIEASKIKVLNNFIPDSFYRVDNLDLLVKNKKPYFLYFGRLAREKGLDLLVEAYKTYRDSCTDAWGLKIVGDGPEFHHLEKKLQAEGLENDIQMLGKRSGLELRGLIESAHYSIMPSIWYENMPYSILESLALGTPVIGSDQGGIPETIDDGVNGFIFESRSHQSMINALCKAYSISQAEYQNMVYNCVANAESKYSSARYLDELIRLYSMARDEG